ncbi:MAG: NAD(+)/NADH kinase [Gemmatimonadota bacterium]|nr:NAD(+)/NADH kinase [Gemmatimonadota bacterium]
MRVAIIGNPDYADLEPYLARIERAVESLGIDLAFEAALARGERAGAPRLEDLGGLDLVLTLGGDGTLLRGARLAGPRGIPVLGCNLGRLGFLTLVQKEDLEGALEHVASDRFDVEERLALDVSVWRTGEAEPRSGPYYGVNDAVIHKSGFARLIGLRLRAGDDEVGHYSADGIILATATGSTAYSLSAGGPIVVPTMDGIIATPISPHTLAVRPVVFPGSSRISVELLSGDHDLQLTVDGQPGCTLEVGDRVEVVKSDHPVKLVRPPGYSFFKVLKRKLRWGDVRSHADPAERRDRAGGEGRVEEEGIQP